ncbi:MAG: hypothetical protein R2850_00535 [Bacteroidia bacterium]
MNRNIHSAKLCLLVSVVVLSLLSSCKKDPKEIPDPVIPQGPKLIVKLSVDSTQQRLGNTGQPASIGSGNAAQSPVFNAIAAHYFELAPSAYTLLGEGEVVYHAEETTAGGANAIDFSKSIVIEPGETFLEIPLASVTPGTYEWVRLSLSYQNYDVKFYYNNLGLTGTLASFVGYNSYIQSYLIKNQNITVNGNRLQGYWGFETAYSVNTGQAPPGATTVPNPLFNSSPIPAGSCVVTGQFENALVITGHETQDIVLNMSLSVNKSFEWVDSNNNGLWDVEPGANENVVDMGLRGLIPKIE